jgi:hypothetical protein
MTLGKCPLCGSRIRAEDMSSTTRLACEKCHSELHMGPGGKLVLGAAHQQDDDIRELKRKIRQFAGDFPTGKVLGVATLLLALGLGWHFLFGPAQRLDSVAEEAARALAGNDPAALESLAADGTAEDVRRWYDVVHPRLDQLRADWAGKIEFVEAVVTQEVPDQRKGSVGVSIRPEMSGGRDVSLANPAEATASATVPFEQVIEWTLTPRGRWKLDGRATLARVSPSNQARK